MLAAMELLVASTYEPALHAAIHSTLGDDLDRWLTSGTAERRSIAATHGYVTMLAFGLVLESWRPGVRQLALQAEMQRVATALASPSRARRLPTDGARHLDESAVIDTGDVLWDSMLRAVLTQVGTRGFEAATVQSIAAEAGCSETVLFRRYATKREAFLDATRRMFGAATALNVTYQRNVAARHSPGVAEAIMLREFLRPGRDLARIIGLEQHRLAQHDPLMREALEYEQRGFRKSFTAEHPQLTTAQVSARIHLEFVLGMGPVLLAQLHPPAWELALDTVTVPLLDPAL